MPRQVIVAVLAVLTSPALAADLTGTVAAIHDGDTLTLSSGEKIRLFGIDAPELRQKCLQGGACVPCGQRAREALVALTASRSVVCVPRSRSYDRIVGECSADGKPLGPAMLRQGAAVAYERYLKAADRPAFLSAQEAAKGAGAGLWGGIMVQPERWRRGDRLACEGHP